jgi:hypothetical protein
MRRNLAKLLGALVLLIVSVLSDRPSEALPGGCVPYWCCDPSCNCIRRCQPDGSYYGGCLCEEACICY